MRAGRGRRTGDGRWRQVLPAANRWGQVLPAAIVAPAAMVFLAAIVAPASLAPDASAAPVPAAATASAATGCSTAKGTHVALVIDLGSTVERACALVPSSDTEAEALSVLSSALHWTTPRYASSGLLCAIDDQPRSGCGTPTAHGYAYWSSWQGAGSWSYTDGDPSTTTVASGTTIGWRYQPEGKGNPTDPPPRAPSLPSRVCVKGSGTTGSALTCASPPLTTSPPPTTSTTTTRAPVTTTSGAAPTATTVARGPSTPGSSGGGGSTGGSSEHGPSTSGTSGTTVAPGSPTSTTHPVADRREERGHRSLGAAAGTSPPGDPPPTSSGAAKTDRLAATPATPASATSAPARSRGTVLPFVVVGAALVGLTGAVVTGRRRRASRDAP